MVRDEAHFQQSSALQGGRSSLTGLDHQTKITVIVILGLRIRIRIRFRIRVRISSIRIRATIAFGTD